MGKRKKRLTMPKYAKKYAKIIAAIQARTVGADIWEPLEEPEVLVENEAEVFDVEPIEDVDSDYTENIDLEAPNRPVETTLKSTAAIVAPKKATKKAASSSTRKNRSKKTTATR